MPIYTKKASPEWITAFKKFEAMSGFEIMRQEEIDSGEMTPYEVWHYNVRWLEDLVSDVINIDTPSEDN